MQSSYEKFMSNWLFSNLPNSQNGILMQDIDFIIQNYKNNFFIVIELKTRGNELTISQKKFYNMLHKRLSVTNNDGWFYKGTYAIEFEGDNFEDGNVYLSGTNFERRMVYEQDLLEFLYDKLGIGK